MGFPDWRMTLQQANCLVDSNILVKVIFSGCPMILLCITDDYEKSCFHNDPKCSAFKVGTIPSAQMMLLYKLLIIRIKIIDNNNLCTCKAAFEPKD